MMEEMFTVKTALAKYFQGTIGESRLRESLRRGEIPHVRIGSRYIMRREALDQWMQDQEVKITRKEVRGECKPRPRT